MEKKSHHCIHQFHLNSDEVVPVLVLLRGRQFSVFILSLISETVERFIWIEEEDRRGLVRHETRFLGLPVVAVDLQRIRSVLMVK